MFLFSCDWDKAIIECCMTIILCEVLPEPGHTTIIAIISHHKYIHRCRKNIFICRSTALVSDRDSVSANTHVSELVSGISSHVRWLTVVCLKCLKNLPTEPYNQSYTGWLRGWRSCWLLITMRFSFHTNLQTALDKVEGHHCCVCEAAAQDAPKAAQSIVLWGAKVAADFVCGRREGTQHAHAGSHATQDKDQNNGRVVTAEWKDQSFSRTVYKCTVWTLCQVSSIIVFSTTNMPPSLE